jgi:tetratricopeptide (TPR) repeat protein
MNLNPSPTTADDRSTAALRDVMEALGISTGHPPRALDAQALRFAYEAASQALEQGQVGSARAQFEALVAAAPLEQRVHFGLGLCLQDEGRIADALRHYSLAYLLDASDAACAFRMGECLAAAGQTEAARESFEAVKLLCALPSNSPELGSWAQQALERLNA